MSNVVGLNFSWFNGKVKLAIKLLVVSILMYYVLKDIQFEKIQELFLNTSPLGYVFYFISITVMLIISSLKFKHLIWLKGVDLTFFEIFKTNWIGIFFNNIVPGNLGSDTVKFIKFKDRFPHKEEELLNIVLIDKITALLGLFLFGGWYSIYKLPIIFEFKNIQFSYLAITFIFLMLIATVSYYLVKKSLVDLSFIKKTINQIINTKPTFYLIALVYQLFIYLCIVFCYFVLFYNMDVYLDLLSYLTFVPMITFSDLLPISINGLGVRESFGVLLFNKNGITKELVLFHFLSARVLTLLFSIFGAFIYLFENKTN